jgi:hypothetical protein
MRWWLMAPRQKSRGGLGWLLIALLGAAVLAAFTQRAAATGLASAVADVWVSAMSVILRLIAAIFGRS